MKTDCFFLRQKSTKVGRSLPFTDWLRLHENIPGVTMTTLPSYHRFLKSSHHLIALKGSTGQTCLDKSIFF
jgi:hypothetical protein